MNMQETIHHLDIFFSNPKSGNIVILGGGESGTGAALLAQKQGFGHVFLSDSGSISQKYVDLLDKNNIDYEQNGHSTERILHAGLIIKSPGIPNNAPLVLEAGLLGIPIIDELEFASRFSNGRIIGISGSNGKTTTTLLCYHLLLQAGLSVGLGGNVGQSMAAQLAQNQDFDWWVLEISSFQLEGCYSLTPQMAILLNITPDHLDRYEYDFDKYIDAKFRLIQNLPANGYFIAYLQNPAIAVRMAMLPNKFFTVLDIGQGEISTEYGAWADAHFLHFCLKNLDLEVPINELSLAGPHNQLNVMAAGLTALLAGVGIEPLKIGLHNFSNAPHRLEKIAFWNGITFVNDSKATNTDSALQALLSFPHQKIIWIAGGKDKGNDYTVLENVVVHRVSALICLGKDNTPLLDFFGNCLARVFDTHSIQAAIDAAFGMAQPGDVVLLSPACASFDLFENYQDRGNKFVEAVKAKIADGAEINYPATN